MDLPVLEQFTLDFKALMAKAALKGLVFHMGDLVDFQVSLLTERLVAQETGKWSLTCVNEYMALKLGAGREGFEAEVTL